MKNFDILKEKNGDKFLISLDGDSYHVCTKDELVAVVNKIKDTLIDIQAKKEDEE